MKSLILILLMAPLMAFGATSVYLKGTDSSSYFLYFKGEAAKEVFQILRLGVRSIEMPHGTFLAGEEIVCSGIENNNNINNNNYACGLSFGPQGIKDNPVPPLDEEVMLYPGVLQVKSQPSLGLVRFQLAGEAAKSLWGLLKISRSANLHCSTEDLCEFVMLQRGIFDDPLLWP